MQLKNLFFAHQDNGRCFGGSQTSVRQARNIAYAWRQHRSSGSTRPFTFTVTSVFRPKTAPKTIIEDYKILGFVTEKDRQRGVELFRKDGYDILTPFRDVNATFALAVGRTAALSAKTAQAVGLDKVKSGTTLRSTRIT